MVSDPPFASGRGAGCRSFLPSRLLRMIRLLLLCLSFAALTAGEAVRPAFFNQKVSARTVALNQPVRLELTTVRAMARSICASMRLKRWKTSFAESSLRSPSGAWMA